MLISCGCCNKWQVILLNRLRLWDLSGHHACQTPGRLKASEHKANFQLLKCAAELWLPLIKRNSSILSLPQSQTTPTFLIIKSAVDFIKRKRVQGRTLTKCRKQIPRLVEASLGRHQKQYTSPEALTRQQLSPWTSLIPNRNWKRVVEMASSLEGERN